MIPDRLLDAFERIATALETIAEASNLQSTNAAMAIKLAIKLQRGAMGHLDLQKEIDDTPDDVADLLDRLRKGDHG